MLQLMMMFQVLLSAIMWMQAVREIVHAQGCLCIFLTSLAIYSKPQAM
jgi:hypothetical protein